MKSSVSSQHFQNTEALAEATEAAMSRPQCSLQGHPGLGPLLQGLLHKTWEADLGLSLAHLVLLVSLEAAGLSCW